MQKVLTAEEMREVDRLTTEQYKIPSIILMENAAHAAARAILERFGGDVSGRRFLILCGKGNNGGDGAALGRILSTLGAGVLMFLFGKVEETNGDARANFEICRTFSEAGLKLTELTDLDEPEELLLTAGGYDPDIVVDAVFGTGLTRPVDERLARLLSVIFRGTSKRPRFVSLDIPSGLPADEPNGFEFIPFIADLTVTFTAPKLANVFPPASSANGELVVANIGSPRTLIDECPSQTFVAEASDARKWLRKTRFDDASYKNKRGHALLVAGSSEFAGAAVLAANSAIVSGVGLVTLATSATAVEQIAPRLLAEVILRGFKTEDANASHEIAKMQADAMLVGSGLTNSPATADMVRELVEKRHVPMVLDADALNVLSPFEIEKNNEFPLILTPHEGEFRRLCGTDELPRNRIGAAREFAAKYHVILVLKGERSLIAHPDGRVVINPTGNSGLGKAGNGDTLAGIITGFVAQAVRMEIDIFETVVAAVYVAGVAGDIAEAKFGKRTMLASDVRESLADAFEVLGE